MGFAGHHDDPRARRDQQLRHKQAQQGSVAEVANADRTFKALRRGFEAARHQPRIGNEEIAAGCRKGLNPGANTR